MEPSTNILAKIKSFLTDSSQIPKWILDHPGASLGVLGLTFISGKAIAGKIIDPSEYYFFHIWCKTPFDAEEIGYHLKQTSLRQIGNLATRANVRSIKKIRESVKDGTTGYCKSVEIKISPITLPLISEFKTILQKIVAGEINWLHCISFNQEYRNVKRMIPKKVWKDEPEYKDGKNQGKYFKLKTANFGKTNLSTSLGNSNKEYYLGLKRDGHKGEYHGEKYTGGGYRDGYNKEEKKALREGQTYEELAKTKYKREKKQGKKRVLGL